MSRELVIDGCTTRHHLSLKSCVCSTSNQRLATPTLERSDPTHIVYAIPEIYDCWWACLEYTLVCDEADGFKASRQIP